MVTKEYEIEGEIRRRTCRYYICREVNAFTVLLFGLGVLCFFVGLCTDVLTLGQGIVGGVALCVLAYPVRVYFGRWHYSETAGSRTKAQTPEVEDQIEMRYIWDATRLTWVPSTEDEI